jgi:hypothetical protein
MAHGLGRRGFLALSLATASAGAARSAPGEAVEGPARIGRVLLAQGTIPRDAAVLRAELGAGRRSALDLFRSDWDGRIRQDFATDRVVSAAGWTLSRTEGVLCALAALEASGGEAS